MTEYTDDDDPGLVAQLHNDVPISLKILASHLGVGAIIGKHGSSITEIQSASEAKIQISALHEVFPGTTDRIMLLSGEMLKVMSALHMIMQKWKSEGVFRDNMDIDQDEVQLRILLLDRLCGAIIGESGKTIHDIKNATQTEISVQSRERCARGVSERIITIVGYENHVLQAVGRILKKCLDEPAFEVYQSQSLTLSSITSAAPTVQALLPDDPAAQAPCQFSLKLTNDQAGAVLGVRGANISTVIKTSGAKVSMQSREEVDEGDLRELEISGPLDASSTALNMVVAKLREAGRDVGRTSMRKRGVR